MNDSNEKTGSVDPFKTHTPTVHDVPTANFQQSATLVGELLDGRFQIEENLTDSGADAGGIGLVYLAKDMKLMGREVVVKILQKAALENSEIIRKFEHEKEALIRLEHPNIVRILDSGALSDGNPFMVMEYIAGSSLRKLLREKRTLPFDLVAHITESVTAALAAAHAKKILHRDIKPENIMLSPQGDGFDHVRLIDFGISRVEESQLAPVTTVGHGAGTLRYIAPEQLSANLNQTPAADIYAFSIVVYEMLTGELPFKPQSVVEMYEMQKQGVQVRPTALRPGLSPRADEILLSGLAFDAADRPQDARQFGRDLASALKESDPNATATAATAELAQTQAANQISVPTMAKPAAAAESAIPALGFQTLSPKKSKAPLWIGLAFLVLAALAIPAIIAYRNSDSKTGDTAANDAKTQPAAENSTAAGTERQVSYFLNVQKMRDGKPFEAPFKSSGRQVFESGYKFSMVFRPDADGYMYIFNEGNDTQGKLGYYLLFPTPSINGGLAKVAAGQQIETARNTFSGTPGTEIMWIVWTANPNADLDAATDSAIRNSGGVTPEKATALQSFLAKYKADGADEDNDPSEHMTVIKAKGDAIAHRFELKHR
ncbi:MAG: serine/threonine-protein kinase [Acidobacteriota bacterium]